MRHSGAAFGKAILIGEHFVLDGAAAIAMPLRAFRTEVTWLHDGSPLTVSSDATLDDDAARDARTMLSAAAVHSGVAPLGQVAVRSTVPLHRGFGSSAALAVAALRALASRPAAGQRGEATPAGARAPGASDDDLLRIARAVECVVHGKSSGLDPATAMGGGAVLYRDGQVRARVAPAQTPALNAARWVLCDVGPAPSTGVAIAQANAARARMGAAALADLLAQMEAATEDVLAGLRSGAPGRMAAGMGAAHRCLNAIDVVDDRIRGAIALALSEGALAAKQSGAGLGGAVLALAPNAEIAETIAARHAAAGLATWTLEIC